MEPAPGPAEDQEKNTGGRASSRKKSEWSSAMERGEGTRRERAGMHFLAANGPGEKMPDEEGQDGTGARRAPLTVQQGDRERIRNVQRKEGPSASLARQERARARLMTWKERRTLVRRGKGSIES